MRMPEQNFTVGVLTFCAAGFTFNQWANYANFCVFSLFYGSKYCCKTGESHGKRTQNPTDFRKKGA